jgi:hypothetical protein
MSNGSLIVDPVEVTSTLNRTQVNFKSAINGFWLTLKNMMSDYADPNKDLNINGTIIPAAQKYTSSATLLFNDEISRLGDAQTTLLGAFNTMIQMEKSLGQ